VGCCKGLTNCRYYQPRNIAEPSVQTEYSADNVPLSPSHAPPKDTNFDTQKSFSDTALTAFAQLIALRLDSQRAIVSLIDHENEYFLAESTSNLSLVGDDGHAQNASLSISGARVPRAASLCEQTLCLVPNQDTAAEMTPVFLVPDLRLDENTSQLDCVKGAPYLRFYCGVALTNKRGVNIGCVYVVDDRPRTDFSLEQAQFLTTMAATVMDHLENIRAKEDIVRVTMMSQALHAFVEGEGTMEGDWQRVKKYNLPAGAGVGFLWESNTNDVDASVSTESANSASETLMSQTQSPLQHSSNNPDARFNFNNSPWSSSSSQVPTLKSVFEGADDVARKITSGKDAAFSNDGFSNQLRTTFSRASNLIREGMEVDGAVFFDAPFRFYQGRSTLETDPRRLEGKDSESSSDEEVKPGPRPRVQRTKRHANHSNEGAIKLKSDVLGYSTRETSSWADQTTGSDASFTAIDQSLLTSLVRHYPLGELFVFDENGPVMRPVDISSLDGSQVTIKNVSFDAKLTRHNARKRAEILRLLKAFPRARQIFFVPLYDSTSGCFVGSFAWSTSATRIFSIENHLSYLIAFGHSVMSEVTRLNTMSADLAKDDFISNVSHELRSPLHGILASVEFLADTVLDGFQRNLVDTVDICGRTLLDTIEHVLDFSKIKKFGQVSTQPMGSVANLDVSAIIEEVLDGVFAGFEFNGLSSQGLADTTKSRMRESLNSRDTDTKTMDELQFDFSDDALTVIIDIDFRDDWNFPTVPGTWRRLTMNLFGNSLKYTSDGYIKVKLEARNIPSVNPSVNGDSVDRTMITMTVSDSGQGMSSEFMKTKLFMPFTQV
jgi:signal transduction histidine kinase